MARFKRGAAPLPGGRPSAGDLAQHVEARQPQADAARRHGRQCVAEGRHLQREAITTAFAAALRGVLG